ncbi:MAG: dihydroorotase [Deltaproteobacteria bacterium]|nr:dihydroorotase [Deltaproteobacteria bacterium]
MEKLLIKNGIVVDPATDTQVKRDIYIENGLIKEIAYESIGKSKSGIDINVIDANNLYVLPGLVDMHVHLREPGFEYKETIKTGMEAAIAGGFTSICCMPNSNPVNDCKEVNSFIINKAESFDLCNLFTIGAISRSNKGLNLANIGDLKHSGAVGISDDGRPVEDSSLMARALLYAKTFDMPVISHSEDIKLRGKGLINEGIISHKLGVNGIPSASEEIAIFRDIKLAEYYGASLHIAHVSTKGSVELIKMAKNKGINITFETCPHYFSITEESLLSYNTNAKMNPPLRTMEDVNAIKNALKDGLFDVIASDHAPHSEDEKNTTLDEAPFGIIGLETSLALTLKLYHEKYLSMLDIAKLMSFNPARILKLQNRGGIINGNIGDITIVDPGKKWTYKKENIKSLSKNSPFINKIFKGAALYVIIKGKIFNL